MSGLAQFERDGVATVRAVIAPIEADQLVADFTRWQADQPASAAAGIRNLLRELPAVGTVASHPGVRQLVGSVLGEAAFPVRALWFDKTAAVNWKVPWHQDLAIAVAERREVPGFTGWSLKDGVLHVHAPTEVLSAMVTVRLQLDDCGPDQGPLRILPGSHLHGRLGAAEISQWRQQVSETVCTGVKGDGVMMRPLLLHASSTATRPGHRRVLHLEFAAAELPGGLRWAFRPASA